MKKILFLMLCVCIPWSAWAEGVEIDGIYYSAIVYVTLAADADIEAGSVLQSTMNEPTITTVDLLEVMSAPQTFTITIPDPNIADGISNDATSSPTGEVYDMQGTSFSKDLSRLRKGVYIVNGKKVVNK